MLSEVAIRVVATGQQCLETAGLAGCEILNIIEAVDAVGPSPPEKLVVLGVDVLTPPP
jgi:hypothetical protein